MDASVPLRLPFDWAVPRHLSIARRSGSFFQGTVSSSRRTEPRPFQDEHAPFGLAVRTAAGLSERDRLAGECGFGPSAFHREQAADAQMSARLSRRLAAGPLGTHIGRSPEHRPLMRSAAASLAPRHPPLPPKPGPARSRALDRHVGRPCRPWLVACCTAPARPSDEGHSPRTMMLAGLRSGWMTPFSWLASSASGDLRRNLESHGKRQRTAHEPGGERAPSTSSRTRPRRPSCSTRP